jgi:hypothetical protein
MGPRGTVVLAPEASRIFQPINTYSKSDMSGSSMLTIKYRLGSAGLGQLILGIIE